MGSILKAIYGVVAVGAKFRDCPFEVQKKKIVISPRLRSPPFASLPLLLALIRLRELSEYPLEAEILHIVADKARIGPHVNR